MEDSKPVELVGIPLKELTPAQQKLYWKWQWNKHGPKEVARRRTAEIRAQKRIYWREYKRNRKLIDPAYRLIEGLRSALSTALRHQYKSEKLKRLLGCSIAELRNHLESQFTEGMTWDKYNYRGWHIDHIKPVATFNLLDEMQLLECFHYTNLRPTWGVENMKQSRLTR